MGIETAIAGVGLAASVASTAVGMMGAQAQAKAQAQAAQYQAQVARNNSIMMQQNADYERQKGTVDAQTQDMANAQKQAAITAAEGASGFDLDSESSKRVRGSAASLGRLDTLTTSNNAERGARQFDIAAKNQTAEAGMYDITGANAKKAGQLNSFATLLNGASSFGEQFSGYKRAGIF